MCWSRPKIYNAARKLSRFMKIGATKDQMLSMERVMNYCLTARERGLLLEPTQEWDGNPEFELVILGRSDSDYAKDVATRKSVGTSTFMCGAPIIQRNTMQKIVALSVTEVELIAATSNAQDMLYVKRLLESIDLRVSSLPMVLEVDNKGAVDLINNFSVSGRTRHRETRQYYLRELKEQVMMVVKWKTGSKTVPIYSPRICLIRNLKNMPEHMWALINTW